MNLTEIQNFLNAIYAKPLGDGKKRHIVFWYDEESDFIEDIDTLQIEGVKILKLTSHNAFYTKYYVEKEDLTNHLLIYSTKRKPDVQEDWLYDIYAYSEEFATDRTTVIMRDMGILDDSLKEVFRSYHTFFKNKDRIAGFKNLEINDYTEEKIHMGVLAVLAKVKVVEFEEIIKVLIKEQLNGENKCYENIVKFGKEEVLWNLLRKYYGYPFEEQNLERFMAMLLITNMSEQVKFNMPKQYSSFISKQVTNCVVFINHFMNHVKDANYYDRMSQVVEEKLKIKDFLEQCEIESFIKCDIYEVVDQMILDRVIGLLESGVETYDEYLSIIGSRRTLHFYEEYRSEYKLLKWAINLLNKKKELGHMIKEEDSYHIVKSYINDYSYIDKAYRKFYLHYDRIQEKERYKGLREQIENVYNNWYLQELAIKWFTALSESPTNWTIEGVKQQRRFYDEVIGYRGKERTFVIISDALRYDCGEELAALLTNERKGKVELEVRQGVIPSYTKLGMAALLPHKTIEINDNYQVLIDGMSSNSLEARQNILQKSNPQSVAIKYEQFKEMGREEIRKTLSGQDVVYIYHNAIDARGDHAVTEGDTFEACEIAFKQIISMINTLSNAVSAANIVVTSDHGFLYKRDALEEFDKLTGVKLEDGEDSRRFILSSKAENIQGTMNFSMDYLLGKDSGCYMITPRGTARFKVQGGGSNYVHGGAMPQEVLIPVIRFKNDRSHSSINEIRKSKITLTSLSRKITNIITYLEFFQEECIKDKVVAERIKAYFEDTNGNRISNEIIIIGDSRSEDPKERTYREKFVLKSMPYDKKEQYFLVIKDEENPRALGERIPFTIDIIIADEFGF